MPKIPPPPSGEIVMAPDIPPPPSGTIVRANSQNATERPGTAHPANLPQEGQIDPATGNQILPATSKRNELGSIFPSAGMTIGSLLGSAVTPGIGTAAGGSFGGYVGEKAKERFEGLPSNPEQEVKSGLLGALPGVAEDALPALGELIPTRAKAGALFEALKKSLENTDVPLKQSLPPLQDMAEYGEAGAQLPGPANKLLIRSQAISPMKYPEARRFQETLSSLSRADRDALNGSQGGNLKQLNQGLFSDIKDAAGSRGQEYEKAMRQYRNAMRIRSGLIGTAKYGIPTAIGAGLAGKTIGKLLPNH